MNAQGGASPLVGRADELDLVLSALHDPLRVGHVLVAGEAGVGKTRLASEVSHVLAREGWTCHRFVGRPGESSVPFLAFAALLADSQAPGEILDRFLWCQRRLTESGSAEKLLVVVDDCQWLGDVSAAFVCFLAATTAIRLLLTRRAGADLPAALAGLVGEPTFGRVELFRLGRRDVDVLVESCLGGRTSESLARQLWDITQGSPMYLTRLVNYGLEKHAFASVDGEWILVRPFADLLPGVEASVDLALGGLGAQERRLAELIAVNGSLGLPALGKLAAPEVLAALERSGVVVTQPSGRRTDVLLAHPLFDEVILGHLGPIELRTRRVELMDALDATGHQRRFSDRMTSALWLADLGRRQDPMALVALARELIDAFREALYPRRPAAATSPRAVGPVDHLDLAARLAGDAAESGGGFAALEVLHAAQLLLGRLTEADEVRGRMGALARSDDEQITVLRLAADRAADGGDVDAATAAIERAAVLARGGRLGPIITAEAAAHRLATGPLTEAVELARSVVDQTDVDPTAAAQAGFVLAAGLCIQGRPVSALAFLDSQADHVSSAENPLRIGALLFARGIAYETEGSFEAAEAAMAQGLEMAEAFGHLGGIGIFSCGLGHSLLNQGRPASAGGVFERAAGALAHIDPFGIRPLALGGLARAQAMRGHGEAARMTMKELAAGRPTQDVFDGATVRAWAWTEFISGRRAEAVGRLRDYFHIAFDKGANTPAVLAAMDLVRMGERGGAKLMGEAAAALEGRRGPCFADYARAVMTADPVLLESTAHGLESLGSRLVAAEVGVLAVEAHLEKGNRARAEACLAYSRRLAAACEGAISPILARSLPRLDAFRHLTSREREVASLAGRGLSNQAITAWLHISPRTVENHLHRVYSKLGVGSRAELSELMGLAGEEFPAGE